MLKETFYKPIFSQIWSLTLHFRDRNEKFNAQRIYNVCEVSETFVYLQKVAGATLTARYARRGYCRRSTFHQSTNKN